MEETPAFSWNDLTPEAQQRYRQKQTNLLTAARAALPFPLGPSPDLQQPFTFPTHEQSLESVDLFIRVGEPTMAWEGLCIIAREVGASAECWGYLMQARELLGWTPAERIALDWVPEYALVLFAFLARNRAEAFAAGTADPRTGMATTLTVAHPSELLALGALMGELGEQLDAPNRPDYRELVAEAQQDVARAYAPSAEDDTEG